MTRIKNGKCGSCYSELILTPAISREGKQDTWVCEALGHLNFKSKEECKNT